MKKVYYIDSILLAICTILFVILAKDIGNSIRIIFALYITFLLFISTKLRITIKYEPKCKMIFTEIFTVILLFLGKVYFLLMILKFGLYTGEIAFLYTLILFALHSYLLLSYTYLSGNLIIQLSTKPIEISKIKSYEVKDKHLDFYYFNIYTEDEKKIKCRLTKISFEEFKSKMSNK